MIERYNYRGDPNIGFYATVAGSQAVLPPGFKREDFFEAETVETFISRTRLVGLFTAGNSRCILVPGNVADRELSGLEESGVDFHVLESRENALGNLVLANDSGALISDRLEDVRGAVSDALDVPVQVGEVAGLSSPGVCGFANNNGVVLHREATEEEAEAAREALGVDNVDVGTVNTGSPYTGSGIVGNDGSLLVGENTTGPEIGRIDRVLQQ